MTTAFLPAVTRSGELVHRPRRTLDAWLARVAEAPLEPTLPILDAHHHLWERPDDLYGIDAFAREIRAAGHDVRGSVFVECRRAYDAGAPEAFSPVGETRRVAAEADTADARGGERRLCQAIVGFADLTLGSAVAPVLEAHLQASGGRFKGVRHRAVWDAHVRPNTPGLRPGLLGDAEFRRGFAVLERLGLSFDAWQYYHQLHELVDLAHAFPAARIVVNHAGGPLGVGAHARDLAGATALWREGIRALSLCENVWIKLGGLGMLHCGFDFHYAANPPGSVELAAAWRPYLEFCIECFGADRCMFESNFPPDRQSCSYGVLWNAFKRLASGFSVADKHALFFATAQRAYRLEALSAP